MKPTKRLYESALIVVMILLASFALYGVGHKEPTKALRVNITSIDYAPDDGDYTINWPGPPRREWTDADKEYYTVTAYLDRPAPCNFQVVYGVRWNRPNWPDKDLGAVTVYFTKDSYQGTGYFWLVCTKKGNVKGSLDKDGQSASLFLEMNSIVQSANPGCPNLDIRETYGERSEHTCDCY